MRNKEILLLFLIFIFIGCSESELKTSNKPFDSSDKEIYELSFNSLDSTKSKTFILLDSTSFDYQLWPLLFDKSYITDINKVADTLDEIMVNDFDSKNQNLYKFRGSFIENYPNIIINNIKQVSELSLDKYYDQYKNFGGIVEVSRIGYNENKTKALLFVGLVYDHLGGEGYLYYLEKQNSNWVIKNIIQLWVA